MNNKLLTGLMAAATAITALMVPGEASAQVTQEVYDGQYTNKPSDLLRLDYGTWKSFNDLVNSERTLLDVNNLPKVDLSKLRWDNGVKDVELYFINEGAGYRNKLFYSTDAGATKTTIFGDIASPNSILPDWDGPLALGEGKKLGNFQGQTFIDFFLQNPYGNVFGFDPTKNPDLLPHVLGYAKDGYVVLGFEDLLDGGDKDYNDTVFIVKGVTDNPASVPEPASGLAALGVGALVAMKRRRQAQ